MSKLDSRDFMHLESIVEELSSLYLTTEQPDYIKGEATESIKELLSLVSEGIKYIKDNLDESAL